MANGLPYGWTEQYAVSQLLQQVKELRNALGVQATRLADLEAELARIDMTKADRRGRKPTAQGDARLGDASERS